MSESKKPPTSVNRNTGSSTDGRKTKRGRLSSDNAGQFSVPAPFSSSSSFSSPASSSMMTLNDIRYRVHSSSVLEKLPQSDVARRTLDRVVERANVILEAHHWAVMHVSEFLPKTNPRGGTLLGLNVNHGEHIKIRLRHSLEQPCRFIPFEEVMCTMLHEICHNTIGPHNKAFYKLLEELVQECEENEIKRSMSSGGGGAGIVTGGGGNEMDEEFERQMAIALAESSNNSSGGGSGNVLGGTSSCDEATMQERILRAAQERMEENKKKKNASSASASDNDNMKSLGGYLHAHSQQLTSGCAASGGEEHASSSPTCCGQQQQGRNEEDNNNNDEEQWVCTYCTGRNHVLLTYCEYCEMDRITQATATATATGGVVTLDDAEAAAIATAMAESVATAAAAAGTGRGPRPSATGRTPDNPIMLDEDDDDDVLEVL